MCPEIRHSDGRIQPGVVHTAGEIDLPIAGGTVDQCSIDHALTLHISCGLTESWHVRIEDQFSLKDTSGPLEWIRIHEGAIPGDLNRPINVLLHREVASAAVLSNGGLRLEFDQGVAIEVVPGEHYEAWQVTGPTNATWVGGPDGTVSVFGPLE